MAKKKPDFTGKVVLMVDVRYAYQIFSKTMLLDAHQLSIAFGDIESLRSLAKRRKGLKVDYTFLPPKAGHENLPGCDPLMQLVQEIRTRKIQ